MEELKQKLERYEKAIHAVMRETYDDDTHDYLNRVLKSEEEVPYHLNRSGGEVTGMVLSGALCEGCGSFIDNRAPGYPRKCGDCAE